MSQHHLWRGSSPSVRAAPVGAIAAGALLLLLAVGCATRGDATARGPAGTASAEPFRLDVRALDDEVAPALEADLAEGRRLIEEYFGMPFREGVTVEVYPSRADFTAAFPPQWGMTETACWMVAAGVADRLILLSPRVWGEEACEHDPHDAQHVRDIVVHELVHVFHGQHNPTGDFTGAEEVGWFAEGLAVHVSGQLGHGHLAEPREAVEGGLAPERLADAWSGKYRYGVCGSLVAYLDQRFGRDAIRKMLAATHQDELLGIIGETESQLLAGWASFVLAAEPARLRS